MPYSTIDDVKFAAGGADRLRELSDFDAQGAIDSATVERAIAEADKWINKFVQKRHGLAALEAVSEETVMEISANHAVFIMKRNRGMLAEEDLVLLEDRKDELDAIATGKRTVGSEPLPDKSELVVDAQTARGDDKAVSREKMEGYT